MSSGVPVIAGVAVEVVADLSTFDAGIARAQASARTAGAVIAADLGKIEAAERRVGAASEEVARVGKAAANSATATERLAKGLEAAERAAKAAAAAGGGAGSGGSGSGSDRGKRAAEEAAAANENLRKTTRLAAHEVSNLSAQLADITVQLAGGQSPFLVLLQQGSQIAPILGSRGVAGSIAAIGQTISSIVSPTVAIFSTLTAAVIYGYSAWSRYDDAQRSALTTLQGLGRNLGMTVSQFEDLARSAAAAGNMSTRQAGDLATALARTGRIGPENIRRIIEVSKDLAATLGTDLDSIKDKLGTTFGSAEGIDNLNRQLRFLDANTSDVIDSLFRQGRAQDAIRLALEKLPSSLARYEQSQSAVARGWEAVKTAVSEADLAVGRFIDRIVRGPSAADRLRELEGRVKALREAASPDLTEAGAMTRTILATRPIPSTPSTQPSRNQQLEKAESDLFDQREQMRANMRLEMERAADRKRQDEINRTTQSLRDEIKALMPGTQQWRERKDALELFERAAQSSDAEMRKQALGVKGFAEAQDILQQAQKSATNAQGEALTQAEKAARQRAIDLADARAVTDADRARVARMRQEQQQIGQLATGAQAREDAEHAARMELERSEAQVRAMIRAQQAEGQELQARINLLGQSSEAQAVAAARQRAINDLTLQGKDTTSALSQEYIGLIEANARLSLSYEKAREAQQRLVEGQRQIGQMFSSFLNDILSGTGRLSDAFANIGRSITSSGLQAILTGEGGMATLLGTAPTERGQLGGLLGGNLGIFSGTIKDAVREGTTLGTKPLSESFEFLRDTPLAGFTGRQALGIGGGALAIASAYGTGTNASSRMGALLSGGVSGALGGALMGAQAASIGGPVGAVAGGVIGAALSLFGFNDAEKQRIKEAKKQAEEAYQAAKSQIDALRAQFRGEIQGALGQSISQANQQAYQAMQVAAKAGREAEANAIYQDFQSFTGRVKREFAAAFEGNLSALSAGLGTSSPFVQARDQIRALGDSLLGFVNDTALAFNGNTEAVGRAAAAAFEMAKASMAVEPELSDTARRLEEIRGKGAALAEVMTKLGISAADAATIVRQLTDTALADLRDTFSGDLTRSLREAQGKSFLNEAADLVKEVATLRADAASLGLGTGDVDAYFTAAAQQLVDQSQLAGDAFQELARLFPELTGRVREYSEAAVNAADLTAAASRRLGYGDRLFAAGNDTSTLQGALAAQEREFQQEREEEIRAGGQALLDLERAQYAERAALITEFAERAAEAERQRYEEAVEFLSGAARTIRQFLDNLTSGSGSTLSPQARLAAAQSQYAAQLAAAQGGNRDALSGITGNASNLLDAARAYYGSSAGYQAIFGQVQSQLGALPSQVSPEQFIVNAIDTSRQATVDALTLTRTALQAGLQANSPVLIAQALDASFNTLDTSLDGLLSAQEFLVGLGPLATKAEQQQARDIFNAIDANGDGQLDKLELVRARAAGIEVSTGATKNAVDQGNELASQTRALIDAGNALSGTGNTLATTANGIAQTQSDLLVAIRDVQTLQRLQLEALNGQFSLNTTLFIGNRQLDNNMVTALNKIVYNTALTDNARNAAQGVYAEGGWVTGPGTGTSDSIVARLSNGEFVMRAAMARQYGPMLEAMNDNRFQMPAMPVPVAAGGDGAAMAAAVGSLRGELVALRAEVVRLRQATVAGAVETRDAVEQNTAVTEVGNRAASRADLRRGRAA